MWDDRERKSINLKKIKINYPYTEKQIEQKWAGPQRPLWQHKEYQQTYNGSPEGEKRKGGRKKIEVIIPTNFPNVLKNIDPQVQGRTSTNLNRIAQRDSHIRVKPLKAKDSENILIAVEKNDSYTVQQSIYELTFHQKRDGARRQQHGIFKELKEKEY